MLNLEDVMMLGDKNRLHIRPSEKLEAVRCEKVLGRCVLRKHDWSYIYMDIEKIHPETLNLKIQLSGSELMIMFSFLKFKHKSVQSIN